MDTRQNGYLPSVADILFGSYIRYDRLYEMTKFATYGGKIDNGEISIYIDAYSILKSLYTRGTNLEVRDSYAIASCLINLAIHLRAYFETRHHIQSKIYIIYGGARPKEAFVNFYGYNVVNMIMEDSNPVLRNLIVDNLNVIKLLCPYLYDIYYVIDMNNEFSVITSALIDDIDRENLHVIYSKDPLSYQLVAFKNRTFLYRPKKSFNMDNSWAVTKSTLFDAYRYGELKLKKEKSTTLDYRIFSIFQSIAGVKSRSLKSIKSASSTIKILEDAVSNNIFFTGYNASTILYENPNPFERMFAGTSVDPILVTNRFASIDLPFQTSIYKLSFPYKMVTEGIINLYDPQEIRNINDKYFYQYPLDLNRV